MLSTEKVPMNQSVRARFKFDVLEVVLMLTGVAVAAFTIGVRFAAPAPALDEGTSWPPISSEVRQALFDELKTVSLKNCTLKRYGSPHGGGYLMCANLTQGVESAYSYGIDREDNWGCDVSRELGVPIHQYDCFTNERPECSGGHFVFHSECVGPRKEMQEGKPFDTVPAQIAKNGDSGKTLLFKIDVEGAEWESLLATPDEVLDTFEQIPMEFHMRLTDSSKFVPLVKRLKEKFYLVNLHFNNDWAACFHDGKAIPSHAFQALWVNKRVGVLDEWAPSPAPISALNAVDNPNAPDCQPVTQQ